VFTYLYKHCIENEIDVSSVELKIFACRGFCPVGEFATVVGGNTEQFDKEQFVSTDKENFYEFLRKQSDECTLQEESVIDGGKKKRASRDNKKTRRSLVKSARRTVRKSRGGRSKKVKGGYR
jgi:hypothetical protein